MENRESMLLQLPFFEQLARAEESSADWRETTAGLVTLRLFDAWLSEGSSVVAADAWGLRAVRQSIEAVDSGNPVKAILESLVDSMEQAPAVRVAMVAPRLLAYGKALHFNAKWELAADVYSTILGHSHPMDDADVVIAASMQLGYCRRMLAAWSDAAAAYTSAGQVAAMTGDIINVLRSRIAEAKLATDRGNLPRADQLLDETIRRAGDARLTEVRAIALHDRSAVAFLRGNPELAIQLAYEAMGGLRDQAGRDRALGDIAAAFYELGLRGAARDAWLILAATAQEQYIRWAATTNLMECAAADGCELVFEQYRRELADAALPFTLESFYHFYVGEGYRTFGRNDQARAAFQRALEIASRHGVSQVLIKAEESLKEIKDGGVVIIAQASEPEPAPEVARVARAIRDMRALAGVG
jgi:tetratricopeptide (TPR) repeat protein